MNLSREERNQALDGIRGIAALLVFVVHTHLVSIPGGLSVDIFFVLSGYLITHLLLRQLDSRGEIDLVTFYVHRFTRLAPALVVMCVLVVVWYAMTQPDIVGETIFASMLALTYTANIYLTVFLQWIDPFSHTWSLAQEEQFYLIWPLVLVFAIRRGVRRQSLALWLIALSVISAIAWFRFGAMTPFNPLLTFGGLVAGSAAAIATFKSRWSSSWIGYLSLAIFAAAVILESFGILSRRFTGPITWLCMPFVFLMLANRESYLKKVLSFRPLCYLGKISYGFYLWHYPILIWLTLEDKLDPFTAAIALALTLAISTLSFHVVERPIARRRDELSAFVHRLLIRKKHLADAPA